MKQCIRNTKSDIIAWIHDILNIKLQQLQQLGTGVVYCQLLNHYKPRSIHQSLLNYQPRNQHQYISNLKLFQSGLLKLNCKRRIDIQRLSKMKFQDNWDTISWLRKYLIEKQQHHPLSVSRFNTPIKFTIPKENIHASFIMNNSNSLYPTNGTPIGKSSITSTLMQNNYLGLIDRMKQVLSSEENDTEKVRLLSILLNIKQKEKERINQLKQRTIDSEIKELIE